MIELVCMSNVALMSPSHPTFLSGNRYTVRSIAGHISPVLDVQQVDPMMKVLCFWRGTLTFSHLIKCLFNLLTSLFPLHVQIKLWNVNTYQCLNDFKSDGCTPVVSLVPENQILISDWTYVHCPGTTLPGTTLNFHAQWPLSCEN